MSHETDVHPPNTLFSSHQCRYCKIFLSEITRLNIIDTFNIVDVLRTPMDTSKVKVVPTIVINNQRVLSGRDAFAWLENEKKNIVIGVDATDVKDGFAGASTAFTFINDDSKQSAMSCSFSEISIEDRVNTNKHVNIDNSNIQIQDRMEALKKERNLIS